ncbi:MAG: hypothetical protein R3236_00345 [Phycisphaeraceae bacterium]|nr:hypothetical protein [Phycisphaeraceae bacterium]
MTNQKFLLAVLVWFGVAAATAGAQQGNQKPLTEKAGEQLKKAGDELDRVGRKIQEIDTQEAERFMAETPPVVGGIIVLVALVPLFAGWLMLRVAYTLLLGAAGAVAAYGLLDGVDPPPGDLMVYGGTAVAGLVGAVLGWFLSKATAAVAGAVVMAFLFMMPGAYLQSQTLMVAMAPIGLIVGLVIGWKIGLYLDALNMAVLSAFFVAVGASIVAREYTPDLADWIALGTLIGSAVIGTLVQFKQVAAAQEIEKEKLADVDYRDQK